MSGVIKMDGFGRLSCSNVVSYLAFFESASDERKTHLRLVNRSRLATARATISPPTVSRQLKCVEVGTGIACGRDSSVGLRVGGTSRSLIYDHGMGPRHTHGPSTMDLLPGRTQ